MLVVKNCKFIPELTEGTTLTEGNLYLENGVITKITPVDELPEGAADAQAARIFGGETADVQVLDAQGATVMPGLIDMHTHMQMGASYGSDLASVRPTVPSQTLDCLRFAQAMLNMGYTTVRDVGDVRGNPTFAIRNAINSGLLTGPRMICSGLTLCPHERGIYGDDGMLIFVDSPMEMRKAVRSIIGEGSDMVKIYASGSMLSPGSQSDLKILEEDEVREAVTIAASAAASARWSMPASSPRRPPSVWPARRIRASSLRWPAPSRKSTPPTVTARLSSSALKSSAAASTPPCAARMSWASSSAGAPTAA